MIRTVVGAGLLTISTVAAAAAPAATLPSVLHGVWMPRTSVGKAQCARFLAAERAGNVDRASTALVGATIISGSLVHSYAEYGEGNFAEIKGVTAAAKGHWTARVLVGFDSLPDPEEGADGSYDFVLRGTRLSLTQEVDKNRSGPLALQRCTARLPAAHGGAGHAH